MKLSFDWDSDDEDEFILTKPLTRQTAFGAFTAPVGFHTDLASVPWQVLRSWPRFGRHAPAAITHDLIYREPGHFGLDREDADRVFKDLLRADGVRYGDVEILWRAGRAFGGSSWS